MKKIAALIPAFNAAETISQAVESMLWQEIPDGYSYEVIVLDDGSADGTLRVLEQIARRPHGRRLRILSSSENAGVARSCGRLIAASDADCFLRMDADDIALPGRVVAQLEVLEAGHDLVGTFAYNFGAMHGERKYSVDSRDHLILAMIDQRSFCHPTIAFNRKVARIGYGDYVAEDYGLLTGVLAAGLSVTNIPASYLMYRVYDESMSSAVNAERFALLRKSVCAIRASYLSRLLGIDSDAAHDFSNCIEKRIFRRNTPDELATLDRLGEIVRRQLGAAVNFRQF